jgi:hypothetical protein
MFLKGYRRVRPGMNPEFEIGRFLTDVARFAATACRWPARWSTSAADGRR